MKLYNGIEIPQIGFGPGGMGYKPNVIQATSAIQETIFWRAYNKLILRPKARNSYVSAIANGMKAGFRLLDYSCAYGDGTAIADAVEHSGLLRQDVFLTGRISNRAQFSGADGVRKQIDLMLTNYRTDYVDLLMFHWPVTDCYEQTWKVICEAYETGKARSVGVANCHRHHLVKLMSCGLKPMINQFEVHPLFTQKDLVKYNQDNGIVVEAYTAIARFDDRLMRLPKLNEIAKAHGKTPVQVVLRWHIQNACVPIVRSLNEFRQRENFNVFDFALSPDEMKVIDGFNLNSRLRFDPDNCDFTIL